MCCVPASLLSTLGSGAINKASLKNILHFVGIEYDTEKGKKVVSEIAGKDFKSLIAECSKKLAPCPQLLCISTSFGVLRPPERWSNYFFQRFSSFFIHFLPFSDVTFILISTYWFSYLVINLPKNGVFDLNNPKNSFLMCPLLDPFVTIIDKYFYKTTFTSPP